MSNNDQRAFRYAAESWMREMARNQALDYVRGLLRTKTITLEDAKYLWQMVFHEELPQEE